ncbi:hypothetical protein [Vulcanococcus limneticus]|uniref:hypothetical protein n=1 Tax=Vulcanococcus limneticus TaxID=2170428 RepID=UPI00398BF69B
MLKINRKGRATTPSKALLTAALLGSTALCCLGAGSAEADPIQIAPVTWFTFNPLTPSTVPDVTYGDKLFHFLSFSSLDATGTVYLDFDDGGYHVNIDFQGPAYPILQGAFSYDVTILEPLRYFGDVALFTRVESAATTSVTMSCSLEGLVDHPCPGVIEVRGQGSDGFIYGIPQPYKKITITDTWNAGVGESITHIQNDLYQGTIDKTPGPLPLFGAGAAFCFSRRIRNRIKFARLA